MGKREHEERNMKSAKRLKVEKNHKRNQSVEKNLIKNQDAELCVEEENLEVECTEDSEIDGTETFDSTPVFDDDTASNISVPATPTSSKMVLVKGSPGKKSALKSKSPNSNIKEQQITLNALSPLKKSRKRKESGTSSEEERWLTAIESGKLEDVDDELKKIKDPKLMTARQRAMYERNLDKEPFAGELLMALPSGYREKEKPQTAEAIQKAALKSQKRKQQADEKREKDKKKTMERLLKKQESKHRSAGRTKTTRTLTPVITYKNTPEGSFILMPPEHEFPLKEQRPRDPPEVKLCGIAGCGNPKVYNCSKTNVPLCSFSCYRKNVQSLRKIMC